VVIGTSLADRKTRGLRVRPVIQRVSRSMTGVTTGIH
jgi:hypothetical protein